MARFVANKKSQVTGIPLTETTYLIFSAIIILVIVGIGYGVYNSFTSKPLSPYQNDLNRIHEFLTKLEPGKSIDVPITSNDFIVYIFDEDYVKENNIAQCQKQSCICAKKDDEKFYCRVLPNVKKQCNTVCVKSSVQEHQVSLERSLTVCRKGDNNNELKLEC